MTKTDLMAQLEQSTKPHYSKGEVKTFINQISAPKNVVDYIKKGDIITAVIGAKSRPAVVIKVCSDICWAMPLSTTKDELNLCESKSRFVADGYFSKQLISFKMPYAIENHVGVYDNPKRLNKAIKALKEELNTVFNN